MKYDPNSPVFPSEDDELYYLGMRFRSYLIGQALQGCACDNRISPEAQAQRAVAVVDETLKLLNAGEAN